jgi:hypothetical protein
LHVFAPTTGMPARSLTIPDETEAQLTFGARRVKLTNLSKVFWEDEQITKRDLLQYYADVAPHLLPHLAERAMVMKRYPNGAGGKCFCLKRVPEPHPAWLETCPIEHKSGNVIDFPVINDIASLLWVVNLGCIDLNQWYAQCDDVHRPDYVHFDLDPVPGATFATVLEGALVADVARHGTPREDDGLFGRAHLCPDRAWHAAEEGVDVREGTRANAGRAKPRAPHRGVSHREAASGARARGLQPERLGTDVVCRSTNC